jgi:phosphoserine phosphatase
MILVSEIELASEIQTVFNGRLLSSAGFDGWDRRPPGIITLDADGTFIDMAEGDHWFTLIKELPSAAQKRINKTVSLLGRSDDTFEQQFLSAGSLYEFAANGWSIAHLQQLAQQVKLRPMAIDTFKTLLNRGYRLVVISHGIKPVLEAVLARSGLQDIAVYANAAYPSSQIVPLIPHFYPDWEDRAQGKPLPKAFEMFVYSMNVVPNTKGAIIARMLQDFRCCRNIAVGDSKGDLSMFREMFFSGGQALLHLHTDRPNPFINDARLLEPFFETVTCFCINRKDGTFAPTAQQLLTLTETNC